MAVQRKDFFITILLITFLIVGLLWSTLTTAFAQDDHNPILIFMINPVTSEFVLSPLGGDFAGGAITLHVQNGFTADYVIPPLTNGDTYIIAVLPLQSDNDLCYWVTGDVEWTMTTCTIPDDTPPDLSMPAPRPTATSDLPPLPDGMDYFRRG